MHRLYTPEAQKETTEFLRRMCEHEHEWKSEWLPRPGGATFTLRCQKCEATVQREYTMAEIAALVAVLNGATATPTPTAPICGTT